LFLADTAVNIDPSAEDLAEIVLLAADGVRRLGEEPVIAMLSFSSYGGSPHPRSDMVRRAVELARAEDPELQVDGEMRVDAALDPSVRQRYADNRLGDEPANVLVFPNLEAANIGFNLVRMLGDAETFGPLILGLDKSVSVLQPHSAGVEDVIRMTAITVVDTQDRSPLQV
jgi:malate dehydrogenase (oxaloacetate-decarboxylating)(NADP+)